VATRSIVTSQPDVECDVCQRRLLRGEQPDVFLAAGEPRMVCELCAPRAAHQGWKRGSAQAVLSTSASPARRGRGLFGRLRQTRRFDRLDPSSGAYDQTPSNEDAYRVPAAGGAAPRSLVEEGGDRSMPRAHASAAATGALIAPAEAAEALLTDPLQGAVHVFNASQYARRVASLARSLGEPEVTVRPGEAVASSVVIVLAWELCWYAYEVDLDDMEGVEVRALAQGSELSELRPEDRLANALADERGLLALL
jgi:hypothetical protein